MKSTATEEYRTAPTGRSTPEGYAAVHYLDAAVIAGHQSEQESRPINTPLARRTAPCSGSPRSSR